MSTQSDSSHIPAHKKPTLSFTETIKVVVGKEDRPFVLPKAIICDRSPFFKAAASRKWLNGDAVKFPEDDPNIADIYFHCAYTGVLDIGDTAEVLSGEEQGPDWVRIFHRLVRTWIFADKVGDDCVANKTMECLTRFSDGEDTLPHDEAVAVVARKLSADSPLYRLFVDLFAHEANTETIAKVLGEEVVPRSFLLNVLAEESISEAGNSSGQVQSALQIGFTLDHPCRYSLHSDQHPECGDHCERTGRRERQKEKASGAGAVVVDLPTRALGSPGR